MIGLWNNDSVRFALMAGAWPKGNGLVDQNVGEFPGHPNGNFDAILIDMGAGFGFITSLGALNFDGVNDNIVTKLNVSVTNSSKFTYEIKFHYSKIGNTQALVSQFDDSSDRFFIGILNDGKLLFRFFVAGTEDRALTTTTLVDDTDNTVAFIKDGGTLIIKINGVEASYSEPNTYGLGNKTYTDNVTIGRRNGPDDFPFADRMYSIVFYSDAISESRTTVNSGLGNDYGLIGINVNDKMVLIIPQLATSKKGLFILARDHLVATVKKVSPKIQTTFRVDTGGGGRRVDIFTLPGRNRIRYDLDHSDRRVFRWRDPLDLNVFGNPKVKTRRKVANKEMLFRVVFNHQKPSEAENDFDSFMEKLGRTIHDGQTATYLDVDGATPIIDNLGNVIHIEPQTFDMNDNKFYGNQLDKIPVDILFKAGIFETDVEDGFLLDGDKIKVLQTAT